MQGSQLERIFASSLRPTKICGKRCAAGRFREDLYYRIHVIPVVLPPYESARNVPLLAHHFLQRFALPSIKG